MAKRNKEKKGESPTEQDKEKEKSKKRWTSSLLAAATEKLRDKFGEWVSSIVPSDSALRGDIVLAVLSAANQWLESLAEGAAPLKSALLERASDFVDAALTELGGKSGKAALGKTPSEKVQKAMSDWMGRFFDEAGERLKKVKGLTLEVTKDALQAEYDRICQEFDLRLAIMKRLAEARAELRPEEDTGFKEKIAESAKKWEELNARLRREHLDKWRERNQEWRQEIKAKKEKLRAQEKEERTWRTGWRWFLYVVTFGWLFDLLWRWFLYVVTFGWLFDLLWRFIWGSPVKIKKERSKT